MHETTGVHKVILAGVPLAIDVPNVYSYSKYTTKTKHITFIYLT